MPSASPPWCAAASARGASSSSSQIAEEPHALLDVAQLLGRRLPRSGGGGGRRDAAGSRGGVLERAPQVADDRAALRRERLGAQRGALEWVDADVVELLDLAAQQHLHTVARRAGQRRREAPHVVVGPPPVPDVLLQPRI